LLLSYSISSSTIMSKVYQQRENLNSLVAHLPLTKSTHGSNISLYYDVWHETERDDT
jgi:methyl coenzyme M reductase subunit C-like uncharacterized protein (methanogenesis marker protein 7)